MNRNTNRIAAAAVAATLTVSSSFAQQAPMPMPQGNIVYVNGQAMTLVPVQMPPQSFQAPAYPQQMNPAQFQAPAPHAQYAYYTQPMNAMPAYIAPPQAMQPPPPSTPYGAFPHYVGQGAGVAGSQVRRISLPTGSPVYVRLISALSSNRLIPGAPFEASLDAPLEVNGMIVAERGARVEGRVSESDAAGKISGQSRLAVQLTRLMTADGKTLDIQTNTISLAGGTSHGRDIAKIAGIAAVGTVLGALSSGRGAAIGAGAGAAAGTAWVMGSRGKATVVPSEQRLEFHLIAPVTFTTW